MSKQTHNEAEAEAVAGIDADRGMPTEGQMEEHGPTQAGDSSESSKDTLNSSNISTEGPAAPSTKGGPPATDPEGSRTKLQTAIIMISLCCSVFLA